jgi:hypothetical protein
MDANQNDARETVTVSIAGREIEMFKPTQDQLVGLSMWNSPFLPEIKKLSSLTDMFLMLLPDDDARGWFMSHLVAGQYTLNDLVKTMTRIATAEPSTAVKKAAKKSAAKKP